MRTPSRHPGHDSMPAPMNFNPSSNPDQPPMRALREVIDILERFSNPVAPRGYPYPLYRSV